jgi:ribose/xylose/arabinose/galactoside ABC-type transport system permease subunit
MKIQISRQHQPLLVSLLIAVLLYISAAVRHSRFGTLPVFINLLDDNAFLGIAAVGMTFVILSGGIDLSVGSVVGLTSILTSILVEKMHLHPALAIGSVLFLGAALGTLMGIIIAFFELAPFLVTLAGMFFARGLAFTLSLDSIPLTHPFFGSISQIRIPLGNASLPLMSLVFLMVVVLGIYIASQTKFGRAVYAIGGSELSSRLMGLPVARTQVLIYAFSGFMSALAGVVFSIYTQSGNSSAATGLELDAIAAVVIGGTLLTGGRGYVIGTLVGTLILGMIQTIITFEADMNSWWTRILIGALLLVFVLLQRLLENFGAKRATQLAVLVLGIFISAQNASASAAGAAAARSQSPALGHPHAKINPALTGSLETCPAGYLPGRKIENGLYQLTGTFLKVGQRTFPMLELPDPAPPYVTQSGEVEIYGSARYFIRYRNWKDFSEGGCYETVNLDLFGPNLAPYKETYTQPWDIRKYRIERKRELAKEVLIGGSMSATKGRAAPVWPEDNITRRIYFFRLNNVAQWVRDALPIVERIETGWLGHSYGGNLFQEDGGDPNIIHTDSPNQIGFFFEKVSDDSNESPYKTEIFAEKIDDKLNVVPNSEVKILGVQSPPLPSTVRTGGGFLIEGPRPLQVTLEGQKFFIIGFSSGDFSTDSYYINYMWSKNLFGPYQPALTVDKKDLIDLGHEMKAKYGLSWMGRPAFYQTPDGHYEMLFHAVIKSILPDNDYTKWPRPELYQLWEFYRCLFKTSIEIKLENGQPVIYPHQESNRLK